MDQKIILERIGTDAASELWQLSVSTFYESFIAENTEANMRHYLDTFLTEEKICEELANPFSEFYFARMEGEAIGYLKINSGSAQTELKSGNGVEIERVYVIKKCQGKNIGQLLFDKAMSVCKKLGGEYLWLGVWEKNLRAIKFYERNGLRKFSSHSFKLGEEEQTDIMMKIDL